MGLKDKRAAVAGRNAATRSQWLRRPLAAGAAVAVLVLAGCSSDDVSHLKRLGLPPAASDRTLEVHNLWIGNWVAAGAIGVLVWGLIIFAAVRYRRRTADLPRQTRYNLPMEIFYTAAPFVIIAVLFYFTIVTQNKVLAKEDTPDHTIQVVGQKWSWTFNYNEAQNPAVGNDVWDAGTIEQSPDLYLPVNESVRFRLSSPDVIHSFWIPSFYFKMDVVPGRNNYFDVTPTKEGTFAGRCAEFCGTYHAAMIFNVHVVSEAEYNAYLKSLAAKGQTGKALGPKNTTTIDGTNQEVEGGR